MTLTLSIYDTENYLTYSTRHRDLFREVLETLAEVAEVAYDTNPLAVGDNAEDGITWKEESIQFALAEVA